MVYKSLSPSLLQQQKKQQLLTAMNNLLTKLYTDLFIY